MEITELQERILINMRLLYHYGDECCTVDNILTRDYHSHVSPWPDDGIGNAMLDLEKAGFINHSSENYALTKTGAQTALHVLGKFFAKTMVDSYNSAAGHQFREHLYGLDLYQHNISTRNQLHTLRSFLSPAPGKDLLDLGCGLAGVAEYFADFGASVTGIDLAEDLIIAAQKRTRVHQNLKLRFEAADIAHYKPDQFYDGIYSIDALQFLSEKQQCNVLPLLYDALKPGGLMAFLYSEIMPSGCSNPKPKILSADKLRLGKALKSNNLEYKAYDFCDEYIPFWQKQSQLARDLASHFEAEGLAQIYTERLDEGKRILGEVLSGKNAFGRYLFVIRKPRAEY